MEDFRVAFNRSKKVICLERSLEKGTKEYKTVMQVLVNSLGEPEMVNAFGRPSSRKILRGWTFKSSAKKHELTSVLSVNLETGEAKEITP